jgi:long-chain acyl-CoA synthetase
MREKEYGIWRPITWRQYLEHVRDLTLGLIALGLERGDKVALMGANRPEGLWAEMASLCAGGVAVWLFQDCLLDEVQYIVDHADVRFLVAEGQEEVDKGLAIKERCPKLTRIIWDDPRGMRRYRDPCLISLQEVERLGREFGAAEPRRFEEAVGTGHGDEVCLLFYTSGTTGLPKGALLTHHNMLTMGRNMLRVDPCSAEDDFVSFLPFAWIGEQMMSISCGLWAGFTINFPEGPETVLHDFREIGPQVMFSSARLYEQMLRSVQVKHLDASRLKRRAFQAAMAIGGRLADLKFARRRPPAWLRALGLLADWAVHRKLRDHLGLSRIRNAYTGGSAMGPEQFRFFHAMNVNLKQIYGQTEIAGISVLHRSDDIKPDTVGKPIPDTEIRVSETGEILSRSPSVFLGYHKDSQATAATLRDGWLHSGDTGFLDRDGHLVFFDRTKDIITLSDGTPFAPLYLESRLKFSPYVKDAWAIGHERPFVAAVVCIDYGVVGNWAEDRGIPYSSYAELSQDPRVYALVEETVRAANRGLPAAARIQKFVNLYKEFDADDEELTRTRKLRRTFVEDRYKEIVDALYLNVETVGIDSTITYEDGRVSQIRATLRIAMVTRES